MKVSGTCWFTTFAIVLALNLEIAAKIKEELRTALDTKELESFARQIACGMVSDVRLHPHALFACSFLIVKCI